MVINTKFDLGQRVWLMHDDKPLEVIIMEIFPAGCYLNANGVQCAKSVHQYGITVANPSPDPMAAYGKQISAKEWEYKLFASKRELCLSFLKEDE